MEKWEETAFNKDTFLLQSVKDLIAKHGIQTVVETGTCHGNTTEPLAHIVPNVVTIELNPAYFRESQERLKPFPNVKTYEGSSPDILRQILPNIPQPALFYLDAHWYAYCPLLDEIKVIVEKNPKPIIVIHDFFVPTSPDLGHDRIKSQRFDYEWIRPMLDLGGPYNYWYNSSATANGSRRGVIFVDYRIP